jgi:hypothetical protein
MVDLVYWSFVLALTPEALDLARKLSSRLADLFGLELSRPFEHPSNGGVYDASAILPTVPHHGRLLHDWSGTRRV